MFFNVSRILNPIFWAQLLQSVLRTVKRFPLASLCLASLAIIFIGEIHDFIPLSNKTNQQAAMLSLGGLFWFVAIKLLAESKHWQTAKHYAIAISVFLLYAWQIFSHEDITISAIGLGLAATLAITFSPWLYRQQSNDSFWYFNFQLISAVFFAGLSALLLSGGLNLILASIGYLFEVKVESEFYGDIGVLSAIIFGGLYFLANIPSQFDYSRADCSQFPKGIQFIQTYVLVPLSLIYMVILYAYFIKIIFQWSLPHGHLSIMVSTFGLIGIITHLTIYPVHDRAGLLGWFYRNFYLIMIIPLGLFILAIAARINQYGLTEKRYILVLIAVWFASLIISYIIRRKYFSLRTVTLSLAVLCIITTIGPLNINKLPLNSQFSRLKSLLIEHDLLVDGHYVKPQQQPDFDVQKSISSMLDYIVSRDEGIEKLRPWFTDEAAFDEALDCSGIEYCPRRYNGSKLVSHMGIDYIGSWLQESDSIWTHVRVEYSLRNSLFFSTNDYDYLASFDLHQQDFNNLKELSPIGNVVEEIALSLSKSSLQIILHEQQPINVDLLPFATNFETNNGSSHLPREISISSSELDKMIFTYSEKNIRVKLIFTQIDFITEKGQREVTSIEGFLLIKTD